MRDERRVLHTQAASSSALSRLVRAHLRSGASLQEPPTQRAPPSAASDTSATTALGDRARAWAFSLLPGSTAHAVGANNGALAVGLNNAASSSVGTGNIATALGIGNAASS